MFESDLIERFSRVHPATPAVLYLPLVAYSCYRGVFIENIGAGWIALHFLAGYVAWTIFEYWMHRLLFHLPVLGPKTARIYFILHGVHHDYPWDESRLVMPPGASLLLCALTLAGFYAGFGAHVMWGPLAGFVFGYVVYDTVHWYVHACAPKNRFFAWVRREHLIHHFKDSQSRFGVSCPWLDYLFRTQGQGGPRSK